MIGRIFVKKLKLSHGINIMQKNILTKVIRCLLINLMVISTVIFANGPTEFKVGVGIGSGYGWLGGGLELEHKQFAIATGIGKGVAHISTENNDDVEIKQLVWDIGIKYFFRDLTKTLRPNIILALGATHLYKYQTYNQSTGMIIEDFEGKILGLYIIPALDIDFGHQDGIVLNIGAGIGIPIQDNPQELKAAFENIESNLEPLNTILMVSLGIKYQF
jgi:hypothetical protein